MPADVVLLTRAHLRALVSVEDAVAAVEGAFAELGRRRGRAPAKLRLAAEGAEGFFVAMPAEVPSAGMAGLKWVGSFPANGRRGLETVTGVLLLNDPTTGSLRAILEAGWLTTLRTGAMVAVAARHLGRLPCRRVAFVGAGRQARSALRALVAVSPGLEGVCVFDPRPEAVDAFARSAPPQAPPVDVAPSVKEAVAEAELVVVATTAARPVLEAECIRRGTRVVALGSGPELADDLVLAAEALVVDSWEQHEHGGGLAHLVASGALRRTSLYGELGEITAGVRSPPPDDALVVASLLGVASLDVALGAEVLRRAEEEGLGVRIPWPEAKRTEEST